MNIYAGNLDFQVNEDDLKTLFEQYGTVDSSKIITDKHSGRSKGFGFIEMENEAEAKKAINELNGTSFNGRNIIVNEAKPKRENY